MSASVCASVSPPPRLSLSLSLSLSLLFCCCFNRRVSVSEFEQSEDVNGQWNAVSKRVQSLEQLLYLGLRSLYLFSLFLSLAFFSLYPCMMQAGYVVCVEREVSILYPVSGKAPGVL